MMFIFHVCFFFSLKSAHVPTFPIYPRESTCPSSPHFTVRRQRASKIGVFPRAFRPHQRPTLHPPPAPSADASDFEAYQCDAEIAFGSGATEFPPIAISAGIASASAPSAAPVTGQGPFLNGSVPLSVYVNPLFKNIHPKS